MAVGEPERFALEAKPHFAMFYTLSLVEGSQLYHDFPSIRAIGHDETYLRKRVARASRKFFANPSVIARNVVLMLRKNPAWIKVGIRALPYLLQATGIVDLKKLWSRKNEAIPRNNLRV